MFDLDDSVGCDRRGTAAGVVQVEYKLLPDHNLAARLLWSFFNHDEAEFFIQSSGFVHVGAAPGEDLLDRSGLTKVDGTAKQRPPDAAPLALRVDNQEFELRAFCGACAAVDSDGADDGIPLLVEPEAVARWRVVFDEVSQFAGDCHLVTGIELAALGVNARVQLSQPADGADLIAGDFLARICGLK